MNDELEYRMYFFVPFNISDIYKGIMSGHCALRYAHRFGMNNPQHQVWDFIQRYETWIILNGGTTNDERDHEGNPLGTLNQIGDSLSDNDIEFAFFHEPDLNNALTALCFIVDERVFNKEDYPDFWDYIVHIKMSPDAREAMPVENYDLIKSQSAERLQEMFPEYYKEWVRFVGGVKNVFLRGLIKDKKLA
jgi:hypothetical protein